MATYQFSPLNQSNIPEMVHLFTERQQEERNHLLFLQEADLDHQAITSFFDTLFEKSRVIATGAYMERKLVGYLLAEIKFDETRGKHVWISYEGLAIHKDASDDLLRVLYSKASKIWLQNGCFNHYVIVPAGNRKYVNAFQRLSFGFEQEHGVLDVTKYQPFHDVEGVQVRKGTQEDRDTMGALSTIILSFQNDSPVYSIVFPETVSQFEQGYKGIVDDEEVTLLLIAESSELPIGFQVYYDCQSNWRTPSHTIELGVAGTLPSHMGSGVGKKLMNEAVNLLKEKGFQYILTDWRITNLASSIFWPKCGFVPVYHRMQRTIDPRISWANMKNPILK
ncbi:GNAT family N-acetyltransferase [Peribacillus alkalitolerans]|uniref:GNAT family N-acetyltransferase n=1 Tax=Peribacillus alkalitolerans TaxID=1550385 RepID=UPI0013CF42E0|nr:GNAT family N-acetyltransferase [Peribacillus alkalitolerans]